MKPGTSERPFSSMGGSMVGANPRWGTPRSLWLTGAVTAVLTCLGVFVLPFLFPPKHPAFSAAYTSGFNNRVAAVAAAVMALMTFGLAWRSRATVGSPEAEKHGRIGRRALLTALGCCAVFTLVMGGLLTRAQVAYNDNLYFLEYMDQVTRYHRHIYQDFSFLYGPALIYFPVAFQLLLRPFHVGVQGAYFLALTTVQLLGILLLYATLEALPLSQRMKRMTLGLYTLCVLCPLMGLNYTLVRSLLPFATLLLITKVKQPLRVAGLIFLGELLQLAVSPELGVAFAAGACFYALCRAFTSSRWYGVALISPPLALLAFLGVTGKIYLSSIAQFSSGCLNLIVEPLPYLLFFLFALVWLVPRWLGLLTRRGFAAAVPMLSLFVLSLALVPAALGRADPLHVFFNGAGMYLLALVAISTYRKKVRDWWLAGLVLILLSSQAVNTRVFVHPILHAVRVNLFSMPESQTSWYVSFEEAARHVDGGRVSVPFFVPFSLEQMLKRMGIYQPDRECFYIGVWDVPTEQARIKRMHQAEWVIVSTHVPVLYETAETTRKIVGFGFRYRDRKAPYPYGRLILDDLAQHWTVAFKNTDWILYHNPGFPMGSGSRYAALTVRQ